MKRCSDITGFLTLFNFIKPNKIIIQITNKSVHSKNVILLHKNVCISAALELPGTLIVLFLISHVSRLKILIGGHLLTGVSLLLITVVPGATAKFCLANLGIVGVTITFPMVYLYSSEVYPTVVRNIGVGLGSVCARIGSMIAPFIATMVI